MEKRRFTPRKGKRTVAESANGAPLLPASSDEPTGWARLAPFLAFLFLGTLYLVLMGAANVCYLAGVTLEAWLRPTDPTRYRAPAKKEQT